MASGLDVQVSLLGVLLAALSSMVVGAFWYNPSVFGALWMRLTGVKMDAAKEKHMAATFFFVFLASLLMAYVLAHVSYLAQSFFGGSFLGNALSTAFWMWLGFVATRFYVHDAFEGRPKALTALNAAHELVTLLAMGLCIGMVQP